MRKKRIAGVILVVIIAAIGTWFVYVPPSWREVINRCTNYDPHWLGMLDCYGVISIWERDDSGYLVQNNNHTGPIVAQIKSPDAFVVEGNEMYLIDVTPLGGCAIPTRGKYCADFQVNGEPKEFGYDSPDKVPTLLVIDTKTGNERFYASLKDAPAGDRAIFEELQKR
jgi:hypothetical protein